jgi:hypothetical protein
MEVRSNNVSGNTTGTLHCSRSQPQYWSHPGRIGQPFPGLAMKIILKKIETQPGNE